VLSCVRNCEGWGFVGWNGKLRVKLIATPSGDEKESGLPHSSPTHSHCSYMTCVELGSRTGAAAMGASSFTSRIAS
jgi:hypothetical protein